MGWAWHMRKHYESDIVIVALEDQVISNLQELEDCKTHTARHQT